MSEMKSLDDWGNPFELEIDRILDRFCHAWTMTMKIVMKADDDKVESLDLRILQFHSSVEALKIELKISLLNRYKNELESMISHLNGNTEKQQSVNTEIQEPVKR